MGGAANRRKPEDDVPSLCQSPPRQPFCSSPAGRLPWFPFGSAAAPTPPPSSSPALGAEGSTRPQAQPPRWRDAGFRAHAGPGAQRRVQGPLTQPWGQRQGGWGVMTHVTGRAGGGGPAVSTVWLHVAADAAVQTGRACGSAWMEARPRPEEVGLGPGLDRARYVILPCSVGRTGSCGGTWL